MQFYVKEGVTVHETQQCP